MSATSAAGPTGGEVAIATLRCLGARRVFGLPGQHALGLFDALRRSDLPYTGFKLENNAVFAADGFARETGRVTPAIVSAGPGALMTLPGLQEAAAACSPVLLMAAQVPTTALGGRHGYLHQLSDQAASFAPVVKGVFQIRAPEQVETLLREAWRLAATPPWGPVYVELPDDVQRAAAPGSAGFGAGSAPACGAASGAGFGAAANSHGNAAGGLRAGEQHGGGHGTAASHAAGVAESGPEQHEPSGGAGAAAFAAAAQALAGAATPRILAGGGVVRAGAGPALRDLAELLAAPVVTTFGGRAAFAGDHPLSAGGWIEDLATTEFLEQADVLLAVGTGLGELSTNYFRLRPRGTLIHLDADPAVVGANYPAISLVADARAGLEGLTAALSEAGVAKRDPAGARALVAGLADGIGQRLDGQDLELERGLLAAVRAATPEAASTFWDMTTLAYWAWNAWDARGGGFENAQCGGLGFALPAAIGAALATGRPTLAVSGDGGGLYSVAELTTLAASGAPVTWLIIDDSGYGVLRGYMEDAYGGAFGTDFEPFDYLAAAARMGIETREATAANLAEALTFDSGRPLAVRLRQCVGLFAPTHLGRAGAHRPLLAG
ncbi:MAG: thiamine pyrophosphate-binding protein [Bifidobacteriaceae bacterium]|nr:thiamine pyrophosphate-binding protein [Bifidobacteriaceae bacterium]